MKSLARLSDRFKAKSTEAEDRVKAAKVYTLLALDICNRDRIGAG